MLLFGGTLLLGGRIGGRFGTRRVLFAGLIGFGGASLLAGAAVSGGTMFAARALQGLFAALVAPAALSLLSTTFTEPRERGIAFGVYGAFSSAGAAAGLILGGVLTEYVDWRWCLYINVPIAVVCVIGGAVTMSPARPATGRLDIAGAVLSCAGLAAVVLGFSQAGAHGWANPMVIGLLAGGVVVLAILVRVETLVSDPLVPLGVVVDRARGGAFLAVLLSQAALFGFFLFVTYFMQTVLDYSPVRAGLAFLPLTASTAVGASVIAARLLPRRGPRPLIVSGLLVATAGMAVLTRLGADFDAVYPVFLLPAQLAIGLGLGLVMMPAMSTATHDLAAAETGIASAVVNASQQVGGAMGTALLNSIAAGVTATALAGDTTADRLTAAVEGYTTGIGIGAGILATTAALTFLIMPPTRLEDGSSSVDAENQG